MRKLRPTEVRWEYHVRFQLPKRRKAGGYLDAARASYLFVPLEGIGQPHLLLGRVSHLGYRVSQLRFRRVSRGTLARPSGHYCVVRLLCPD